MEYDFILSKNAPQGMPDQFGECTEYFERLSLEDARKIDARKKVWLHKERAGACDGFFLVNITNVQDHGGEDKLYNYSSPYVSGQISTALGNIWKVREGKNLADLVHELGPRCISQPLAE
jgi:hypothetical protein